MSDTAESKLVTICFKNIPNFYNRTMVLELLDSNGFKGSYDFVYVPHSFKRLPTLVNLGYFFVNFASPEVASRACATLVGFKDWVKHSDKVMDATWATTTQGQKACIKRFHNSRVKSANIPLECKPLVLEIASTQNNGQVVAVTNDVDIDSRSRVNTLDFFYLHTLVESEAMADDITGRAATKTNFTSSSTPDDASESQIHQTCFATVTWPVSRRSARWCDVADDEPDINVGSMSSRRQNTGLPLTLLQSSFADRGTEKSLKLKNTFLDFDVTPIAARQTRFASSFM